MTAEELNAQKDRFDAVVNTFIERFTQVPTQLSEEETSALLNSLWDAINAYAEALRERGRSIESREVGEVFFHQASQTTKEAYWPLVISLIGYRNSRIGPDYCGPTTAAPDATLPVLARLRRAIKAWASGGRR